MSIFAAYQEARSIVESFPPSVIAVVVRADLYNQLRDKLHQARAGAPVTYFGIDCYLDHQQREPYLCFDDRVALYSYLNRQECPDAYAAYQANEKELAQLYLTEYYEKSKTLEQRAD